MPRPVAHREPLAALLEAFEERLARVAASWTDAQLAAAVTIATAQVARGRRPAPRVQVRPRRIATPTLYGANQMALRVALVSRLLAKPAQSRAELAFHFRAPRYAVQRALVALRAEGLVTVTGDGRERRYHAVPGATSRAPAAP
jgi:hypothetical protein